MAKLLRLPDVLARVGVSRSTLYLWVSKGRFPASIPLGERAVAWLESDVIAWIERKADEAESAALRSQPGDSEWFRCRSLRDGHLVHHFPGIPSGRPVPARARSMSEPGIQRINNGRPFAFVERDSPADFGGGTRLYVYGALRALATFQESGAGMAATWFHTPRGGWGEFLGISHRNARRYIASLEREGRIERTGSGLRHTFYARKEFGT